MDWLVFPRARGGECSVHPTPVKTAAGDTVQVYTYGPDGQEAIIWSHGNAECVAFMDRQVAALSASLGMRIVVYDYPGYGQSTGTPTEASVNAALEAVIMFVRQALKVPRRCQILMGRSIGTGPVVAVASKFNDFHSIILISPFLSVSRIFLPFSPPFFDMFRSYKVAHKVLCPVSIIYGVDDVDVPPSHSRRLAVLFPKASVMMVRGDHNSLEFETPVMYHVQHMSQFSQ